MGLRVELAQVTRTSSDGNTANEGTKQVSVGQARIIFDKIPENADEVKQIDRSGDNGKYVTMALLFAAVRNWTPENGYTPSSPLAVTVEEYVYNLPPSTMYGPTLNIERVVTRFAGADTERYVDFYMDPKDGNWYIWSDTYKPVLADIKAPM